MSNIDIEQVLNGTFHKKLYQGYQQMKLSGLTQESALEYKSLYENAPLSDILHESSLVFAEPIYGVDFYTNIMCEKKIPLHQFKPQYEMFEDFISSNEKNMTEIMLEKYKESQNKIKAIMESRAHEIDFSHFNLTEDIEKEIEEMCDDIYEFEEASRIPSVDSFFENASLENKILYGYYILKGYNENAFSNILHENMILTESANSDADVYERTVRSNIISSYLSEDSAIINETKYIRNRNLHDIICESSHENYRNVIDDIFTEYKNEDDVSDYVGESAVMDIFEDDDKNSYRQDEYLTMRLVNAYKSKAILEAALDVAYTKYVNTSNDNELAPSFIRQICNADVTIKESVDYLIEKVNQMEDIISIILEDGDDSFFEYTKRGEATPTIRSQTGNVRETNVPSNKQKQNNEKSDDESDDDDEDEEDDIPDEKDTDSKKKIPSEPNKPDDVNNKKPDSTNESKSNGKPELQKQSMTRKIQNKAIDMDVKMQKAAGNVKQKATELKNAGKSVLRLPNNILKSMKTGIEEWNTMDEEKRKEKILRPGYRTQIFKMLKTAIIYGAIWQWKHYMVIVAWICKHTLLHPFFKANKNRSERIRNELTAELESEIAVTEEKINDANANGDQKQKYELMRIKKKLEAEKVRVSTNSKYI